MRPYYADKHITIYHGDARAMSLPDKSVQCVVTSPPYWGLRKYEGAQELIWGGDSECKHDWRSETRIGERRAKGCSDTWAKGTGAAKLFERSQGLSATTNTCLKCGAWKGSFGLEPTPELYVEHTIEFLREIRRVLRDDGCVFWNVGDSYASGKGSCFNPGGGANSLGKVRKDAGAHPLHRGNVSSLHDSGLKPKDLCVIPFRVALAAQSDGWWVRSVIVWSKNNPMPESVKDRPTNAHEYILMLTKSQRYYWDADAVKEPAEYGYCQGFRSHAYENNHAFNNSDATYNHHGTHRPTGQGGRNLRDVWTIPTMPFPAELRKDGQHHFATFPEKIPETCIKAATSEKGCCPECGAPWVRVVERTGHVNKRKPAHVPNNTPTKVDSTGWAPTTRATDQWQPSCFCGIEHPIPQSELDADPSLLDDFEIEPFQPIPCTVLDPFAGSGTTLAVAKKLGRRAIGIDISEDYCELARERCGSQMVMEFPSSCGAATESRNVAMECGNGIPT